MYFQVAVDPNATKIGK